jgi:hypothetical protein
MIRDNLWPAHALAASLSAIWLTLAGCSGTSPVMLDTPGGPVTLNTAPPPPSGGLAAPPQNLEPPQAAAQTTPISLDGSYTGSMAVLVSNGNQCQNSTPVHGFRVTGNRVRFGGFRGTIQPDGSLQMTYGDIWIIGRFEATSFKGQANFPGPFDGPGCAYLMNLQRTGP